MIILNLIRVLTLCQGSSPGRFFFPTNVMYFSRGLAAKTMVKRKKLFTALLALSWTFSVTAAERIVVAGGSLTELIYAMGAGKRVVGVDETTSYPPETAKLPHIGYWKQLSSEGILSLRPDSVITWQDAGPQIVLDQLRAQKSTSSLCRVYQPPLSRCTPTFANWQKRYRFLNKARRW